MITTAMAVAPSVLPPPRHFSEADTEPTKTVLPRAPQAQHQSIAETPDMGHILIVITMGSDVSSSTGNVK